MAVVLLFPGQGSQKPGMGRDLAAEFPAARAVFDAADSVLGERLSSLCFDGPAETLTATRNAQPALLVHGAAVLAALAGALDGRVAAAAGHSLGEFSAYHAAGSLALTEAVALVRERGSLMAAAGSARPGTMAAILGDTVEPLDAICERASRDPSGGLVVAANYNAPGQTVISGEVAGVEVAMGLARAGGAGRARRLPVSGAFHSPLMAPAREGLALAIAGASFRDPVLPVYANVNAAPVRDAATACRLLVEQLTSPVRWIELVTRLAADFPDALYVEVGPGTVLSGLVRKIAPQLATASCGTAEDVHQMIRRLA